MRATCVWFIKSRRQVVCVHSVIIKKNQQPELSLENVFNEKKTEVFDKNAADELQKELHICDKRQQKIMLHG